MPRLQPHDKNHGDTMTNQSVLQATTPSKSTRKRRLSYAISAAVMSTGTMVTSKMNHGAMQVMLIRGENGFTILATAGDHILIGASKEIHSIGLTLNTIRDFAEPLESILAT